MAVGRLHSRMMAGDTGIIVLINGKPLSRRLTLDGLYAMPDTRESLSRQVPTRGDLERDMDSGTIDLIAQSIMNGFDYGDLEGFYRPHEIVAGVHRAIELSPDGYLTTADEFACLYGPAAKEIVEALAPEVLAANPIPYLRESSRINLEASLSERSVGPIGRAVTPTPKRREFSDGDSGVYQMVEEIVDPQDGHLVVPIQGAIDNYIMEFMEENGTPPSIGDIRQTIIALYDFAYLQNRGVIPEQVATVTHAKAWQNTRDATSHAVYGDRNLVGAKSSPVLAFRQDGDESIN